jgi:hypothetical protein
MAPPSRPAQIDGMNKRFRSAALVAILAGSFSALPAHAQNAAGRWQYLVQGYLMFPNMKGETGLADLPPAEIDEDPSDIFSNLQMGAMFYFEAHNDEWMFSSDLLYMDLGSDLNTNNIVSDGSASVSQVGFELAAMRRLSPWFELGLSAVYNKIDADVDITFDILTPTTRHVRLTEDWIDPTIVARATFAAGDKWKAQFRGNVGGFGVGSEFFWELQADAVYQATDRWQFVFGYRVIDIDYDHGSGTHRFRYDVQTFGPVLKVGYSF